MPKATKIVPLADESVYNILPPQQEVAQRSVTFRPKLSSAAVVPPTCSTFGFAGTSKVIGNVAGHTAQVDPESHPAKRGAASMGRVVAESIDPRSYLLRSSRTQAAVCGNLALHADGTVGAAGGSRQHATSVHSRSIATGEVAERSSSPRKDRAIQEAKAAVPLRTEKPLMGLSSNKNFVAENAARVELPKGGATACGTGKFGAAGGISTTTAGTRAVDQPGFAKVPEYLSGIKDELQATKDAAAKRLADAAAAKNYDELTPEELEALRDALQARHAELTRQVKSLPFTMETRLQLRRKEVLEADLKAVEDSLRKLSKPRVLVLHQ
jgi:hypothetical protein